MMSVLYLHELACLSCGRECGTATSDTRTPQVLFVPKALRCSVCGGLPTPTGDVIRKTAEPRIEFPKVRRGRPPYERRA